MVDLELQYTLIVSHQHMLTDTSTGATTVLRLTIKGPKWVVAQFLEISTPSPKQLDSSHLLACEVTHPYKNSQPYPLLPRSHSEMAHILSVECFSL